MICSRFLSRLPSQSWNRAIGAVNIMGSFLAVVENSFILFVLCWYKDLHCRGNRFFVSLATADLLVGLTLSPMHVAELLVEDLDQDCVVDETRRTLAAILFLASSLTIAAISYDRYIQMTTLNNYNIHMTRKKITIMIVLTWTLSIILPIFRIFDKKEYVYKILFIVSMFGTFIIIVICYVLILSTLRQKSSWRERSHELEIRQMRTLKTVIIIISCYMLMMFPLAFAIGALSLPFKKTEKGIIYNIVLTFNMLNSSVNPVIYYLRNSKLRRSMARLMRLDTRRRRSSSTASMGLIGVEDSSRCINNSCLDLNVVHCDRGNRGGEGSKASSICLVELENSSRYRANSDSHRDCTFDKKAMSGKDKSLQKYRRNSFGITGFLRRANTGRARAASDSQLDPIITYGGIRGVNPVKYNKSRGKDSKNDTAQGNRFLETIYASV